jgi:ferredoxin
MSTKITEDCINCGACETECPNEAISQGPDVYVIDSDRCTECVGFHAKEACQAVCPVECCVPDATLQESEEVLLARAVALHPDNADLRSAAASGGFESRFRA